MKTYLEKAREIESEILGWRRYLHQNPELGLDLPVTAKYIKETLASFGLEGKEISPSGIVCLIEGKAGPGKTFMLRGDSDALPMPEDTDLPFKSMKEAAAHTCGHDMHSAMLLGAAKLLSENRDAFKGTVKLMFQPGEEVLQGAKSMIDAGLLENPKVDAALGMHVMMDGLVGGIGHGVGALSASSDNYMITIHGKGSHGAQPHNSIDPINVVMHIYQAFQSLIARENPPDQTTIISVCQITSGYATNIIPETAFMQGTLRTYNRDVRDKMVKRIEEIAELTAQMFHARAEFTWKSNVPSILGDEELIGKLVGYIDEMDPGIYKMPNMRMLGSEDFSLVSEKVPSTFIALMANPEGGTYAHHNPKIIFDEGVLVYGSSIYAQCATEWLNNN